MDTAQINLLTYQLARTESVEPLFRYLMEQLTEKLALQGFSTDHWKSDLPAEAGSDFQGRGFFFGFSGRLADPVAEEPLHLSGLVFCAPDGFIKSLRLGAYREANGELTGQPLVASAFILGAGTATERNPRRFTQAFDNEMYGSKVREVSNFDQFGHNFAERLSVALAA